MSNKKISSLLFLGASFNLFAMPKTPNIVLIVADDHGYADFSYKKIDERVKTPNLDKLREDCVDFTNAYSTAPISSPSRCAILTGKHQARSGNFWFGGQGLSEKDLTIAEQVKKDGYKTGYLGKHHYGVETVRNRPENHGFDYSLVTPHGGRTHYLFHSENAVKKYGKEASLNDRMGVSPLLKNGVPENYEGFTTEKFGEEAISFIEKNSEEKFFLQIAFNSVHNFAWQLPDEYLKKHNLPKYEDWNPEKEDYVSWYSKSIYPNLPYGRDYYLTQLYYLDNEIGKIVATLKKQNLYDNTLIFYISDNGGSTCNYGENTPLRGTKYTLYEGGIKIPFFVKFPNGSFAGKSCKKIVSTLDILPTVLSELGIKQDNLDGFNLKEIIMDKIDVEERELFWDTNFQYAIRKGDWKLKVIKYQKTANFIGQYEHTDLGKGVELFNLKDDIFEKNNLAKINRKKVDELTKYYKKWRLTL